MVIDNSVLYSLTVCLLYAYTLGMKRVSMFFTEQQIAALKRLQKKTGLAIAELVRRAIDLLIKTYDGGGGK